MHKNHWDLGVVRSAGSRQCSLQAAADLILAFVKSKAPPPLQERGELCPRWVPPISSPPQAPHKESEKKAPKSTRAREEARASKKEDTSPAPSSLSSLPSVSVSSVSQEKKKE